MGFANYLSPLPSVRLELFLSHSWGNGRREEIHELIRKEWIKSVDYRDHSITYEHPIHEENPRALLRKIARIISTCDVFLVPAGMEGIHSEWMDREIYAACSLGVPIVRIVPNGAQRTWSLSGDMANDEAGWRGTSIREKILKWTAPAKREAFVEKLHVREMSRMQLLAAQMTAAGVLGLGAPKTLTGFNALSSLGPQPQSLPFKPANGFNPRSTLPPVPQGPSLVDLISALNKHHKKP